VGLLDDAIREHLELKRLHGAPDDEIQRAEQEALGPARRDPAGEPAGAGLPLLEEVPGEAIEPPPPPPPAEPSMETFVAEEPVTLGEEAPPVDEPVFADEYAAEPAPADFDDDFEESGRPPEPALPPSAPEHDLIADEDLEEAEPPGTPKPHGDPAIGDYSEPVVSVDEPANAAAGEGESEDVLEETPEFLQDTPEHDKLWFEQKPPRDFDFE
jgi:hypothetical protein